MTLRVAVCVFPKLATDNHNRTDVSPLRIGSEEVLGIMQTGIPFFFCAKRGRKIDVMCRITRRESPEMQISYRLFTMLSQTLRSLSKILSRLADFLAQYDELMSDDSQQLHPMTIIETRSLPPPLEKWLDSNFITTD